MPITFITGSENKFKEALVHIPELARLNVDLPEIQSLSQHEILQAKLNCAVEQGVTPVLVEDTGLYFEGLGSALPGPLIKWFVTPLGNEGLSDLCKRLASQKAFALTTIGLQWSEDSPPVFFEGRLKGKIVSARGNGFGWDAIFEPEGLKSTLAEMGPEEKSRISHRGLAFQACRDFLKCNGLL